VCLAVAFKKDILCKWVTLIFWSRWLCGSECINAPDHCKKGCRTGYISSQTSSQ